MKIIIRVDSVKKIHAIIFLYIYIDVVPACFYLKQFFYSSENEDAMVLVEGDIPMETK